MFEQLLPMLTLAVGGALAVGTVLALVRPREEHVDGELENPPLVRSLLQIAIGVFASIWALVTLFG